MRFKRVAYDEPLTRKLHRLTWMIKADRYGQNSKHVSHQRSNTCYFHYSGTQSILT